MYKIDVKFDKPVNLDIGQIYSSHGRFRRAGGLFAI